ncbi:MAG: nicotinate-nucleotide--dimethylbenzimidazole phosphoribosyltransferase, partial [Caulobacteraceae bacterium]|nr:nicotinate-nucleotide--dimethylbenzimidazole phosphoribosyltransferase [Caulobacteraceae bacterium]
EAVSDPLELLRQLGGRESAALAGAILAARIQGVPVLLDGAPALAAAAVLHAVDPQAVIHCRLGGGLHDPTVARLAARLGLAPILGLWLPLSDGTASMAALSLVRLAVAVADGAPPV